jgi:hypothetical protein
MRPLSIALGALLIMLGGLSASMQAATMDPAVIGLWAPDYTAEYIGGEMDIFPDGTVIQRNYDTTDHPLTTLWVPDGKKPHLEWTINGTRLKSKDVIAGTGNYSNGKFAMTFPSGSNSGTYSISANHRKMTLDFGNGVKLLMTLIADSTGKPIPHQPQPKPQAGSVDPDMGAYWVEKIPMPDKGYTQYTLYEIHPSGKFVYHIQQVKPGADLQLNDSSYDTQTLAGTIQSANGRCTISTTDGWTGSASYVYSPDKQKMTLLYDKDTCAYLFVNYAQIGTDDSVTMSSDISNKENPVIDPRLVRVWIGSRQDAGVSYVTKTILEWHPDGTFVMHVRHVTGTQSPMDVQDAQTYPGNFNAFHGRFSLAQPQNLIQTGAYTVKGDELDMTWDANPGVNIPYQLYGDFDDKGVMRPFPTTK